MNPRIKLIMVDEDGDEVQIFAETDMYSVVGLLEELTKIKTDITKLKAKTGVK